MNELKEIIATYQHACAHELSVALATVVHVEGSSYRRPGARMLVTEEGNYTGAISGGCLEGDALRKAQLAIYEQRNKLVTYDTSDEDAMDIGIQLGCNGIIHILFEPIDPTKPDHPIALLSQVLQTRTTAVIGTFFDLQNKRTPQLGTCLLRTPTSLKTTKQIEKLGELGILSQQVQQQLTLQQSIFTSFQEQQVFLEFVPPALHIVIAGAGNDVQPLVSMAKLVGWEVTIIDGRFSHATLQRFPQADSLQVGKPEEVLDTLTFDPYTVGVLMSHNYHYDLVILQHMIKSPIAYIGALGPKVKLERMLADLESKGVVLSETQKAKIYGPVGLDIGAETSEEIALAIVAEIKAVISQRNARFLRDKQNKIHDIVKSDLLLSVHATQAVCTINAQSDASRNPTS